MDFDLSKPQKLLKNSAREFLARECTTDRVRELMETETAHDDELWQAICDQGWTGWLFRRSTAAWASGWSSWRQSRRRWVAPVCRVRFSRHSQPPR